MSETRSDSKLDQQATSPESKQDVHISSSTKDSSTKRVIHALPDEPYLLGTPSSRPYNMPPGHADNWRIVGLFDRNEEHLQYQTFFYRDPLTTVFSLHDRHVEEARRRNEALRAAGSLRSGPGTPAHLQTGAKKKISLSAYTNKTKHSQSTTPAAQPPSEDSKFDSAGATLVKQAIPSSLSTITQSTDSVAAPQNKGVTLEQHASTSGIEQHKGDPIYREVSRVTDASKNLAKDHSSLSLVSEAATTITEQSVSKIPPEAALETQAHKRTIDMITEGHSDAENALEQVHQLKPAKKPRLESIQEQLPTPAIIIEEQHSMPTAIVKDQRPGISAHDHESKEMSEEVHAALQHNPPLQSSTTEQGGRVSPKAIAVKSGKQAEQISSMMSIVKVYDKSNILTPNILHWFPGTHSPYGDETLPLDIPILPPWVSPTRSTLDKSGGHHSHSPSISDSLKLSAVYSQTSDSSVASSSGDLVSVQREVVSQAVPNQTTGSDHVKKRLEVKSLAEGQVRPPSVSGKTIPQHVSKGEKVPPNAPKVARKTVQATPTPSAFFEALKKKPASASPSLAPQLSAARGSSSLVVKLKYGRSLAKNVQRILQLKVSNKRETTLTTKSIAPRFNSSSGHESGRQDQKSGVTKVEKKEENKRSRDDTTDYNERSIKRKKLDNQEVNMSPKTPNMPAMHSPVSLTPSTSLHRQLLTPKMGLKHGKPGAPVPTASTPQSTFATPSTSTVADPPSGSLSHATTDRTQGWKREHEKQSELATNLKRKMQAFWRTNEGDGAEDVSSEMRKAAVEGVESVLSFMQAFVALGEFDRNSKVLIRAWESIQPLAKEVSRHCHRFEHIHGMSMLLQSLCFSVFLALCAKTTSEDLVYLGKTDSDILKKIMVNLKEMQQVGFQAERFLSRATLAAEYPFTYAEYEKLPVGLLSKPMVAVRMGCQFLGEWTTKQKMEWKMQLEEGLCSQL